MVARWGFTGNGGEMGLRVMVARRGFTGKGSGGVTDKGGESEGEVYG